MNTHSGTLLLLGQYIKIVEQQICLYQVFYLTITLLNFFDKLKASLR